MKTSCLMMTPEIETLARRLELTPIKTKSLMEVFMSLEPQRDYEKSPITATELREFARRLNYATFNDLAFVDAKGKVTVDDNTFTVDGVHIYNKNGIEVLKEPSASRNRIITALRLKNGTAEKVVLDGMTYIYFNSSDGRILMTNKAGELISEARASGILTRAKHQAELLNVAIEEHASDPLSYLWDSQTKRNRINVVIQQFTSKLTRLYNEAKKSLEEQAQTEEENGHRINAEALRAKATTLTRGQALNEYGVGKFINKLADLYNPTTGFPTKVAEYLYSMWEDSRKPGKDNFIKHFNEEAKKIHAFMRNILLEGAQQIRYLNDIELSLSGMQASDTLTQEELTDNGDTDNVQDQEERTHEDWQVDAKSVDPLTTISQITKQSLYAVPVWNKENTDAIRDDIGHVVFADPAMMHAAILTASAGMTRSSDWPDVLDKLDTIYPEWAPRWTKKLRKDNRLMATAYVDFRKDFLECWASKEEHRSDGSWLGNKIIRLNGVTDSYVASQYWDEGLDSFEGHGDMFILNKDGSPNVENIEKLRKTIFDIFLLLNPDNRVDADLNIWECLERLGRKVPRKATELSDSSVLDLLDKEYKDGKTLWQTIVDCLAAIGVDSDEGSLYTTLVTTRGEKSLAKSLWEPLELVLHIAPMSKENSQSTVYKGIKAISPDKPFSLTRGYPKRYTKQLSELLAHVDENHFAVSFVHNGNTRNSYVAPSYMTTMTKLLNNSAGMTDEQYKKWLMDEFGQSEWFYTKAYTDSKTGETIEGHWNNDWLNLLYECPNLRKYFRHKENLEIDGKKFFEADDLSIALSAFREFELYGYGISGANRDAEIEFKKIEGQLEHLYLSSYAVPVLADADSAEYITFVQYSDYLLDGKMGQTILQEYKRIRLVEDRAVEMKRNPYIKPIDFYDGKRGREFCLFPELNVMYVIRDADGNWTFSHKGKDSDRFIEVMKQLDASGEGTAEMRKLATAAAHEISESDILKVTEKFMELGADSMTEGEKGRNKHRMPSESEMKTFVKNWRHAVSQILEIYITDPAFYKSTEMMMKRIKELHSPADRPYVEAEWNGKRVSEDGLERSITLSDITVAGEALDVFEKALVKHGIDPATARKTREKWEKVNLTDGQAFRSLQSYRKSMIMMGKWTDNLETAYGNITGGRWSFADISAFMNPIKPFMYTQTYVDDGLGDGGKIRIGIQHKNSETPIMALAVTIAARTKGTSPMLRALEEFMMAKDIDVVNFASAVKVGGRGAVDMSGIYGEKDSGKIFRHLCESTGFSVGRNDAEVVNADLNDNTVTKVDYNHWGIQTPTPQHFIDNEQLIPSQMRRILIENIPETAVFNIEGSELTREEMLQLLDKLLVDNIVDSYGELEKILKDPVRLSERLTAEVARNRKYSPEMIEALKVVPVTDNNGNTVSHRFQLQLFDPHANNLIEPMISSIIKNTVTKQKMDGGACIKVSAFGLSDDLKIIWEGDGKDMRMKHMECYLPAYTEKFLIGLLKKDKNGGMYVDADRLPDSLRELIGVRIPTEATYSMAPLYIKGFLPQNAGSAVILPAEITLLSGSDFDVDKMFILYPHVETHEIYDKDAAYKAFLQENEEAGQHNDIISTYVNTDITGANISEMDYMSMAAEARMAEDMLKVSFKKWLSDNGQRFMKTATYKRTGERNGMDGTAGMRIINVDVKDEVTGKKKTLKDIDLTGLKGERIRQARNNLVLEIWRSILTHPSTMPKISKPGGFEDIERAAAIHEIVASNTDEQLRTLFGDGLDIASATRKMSTERLLDIRDSNTTVHDPLSPLSYIHFHRQNKAGKSNLGRYAINRTGHSLLAHTGITLDKLGLKDDLSFCDRTVSKYERLYGSDTVQDNIIATSVGQFVGAAADAAKNPTLDKLNQNSETINMTMLLIRMGMDLYATVAFVSQPIIREAADTILNGFAEYRRRDDSIVAVINRWRGLAGLDAIKSLNDLGETAVMETDYNRMLLDLGRSRLEEMDSGFIDRQLGYIVNFIRWRSVAKKLADLTLSSRADTQMGAAGPRIADTIARDISYMNNIFNTSLIGNGSYLDEASKPIGFVSAFQTYGISKPLDLLATYYPQAGREFRTFIESVNDRCNAPLTADQIHSLFSSYVTYRLTQSIGNEYLNYDSNMSLQTFAMNVINGIKTYIRQQIAKEDATYNTANGSKRINENFLIKNITTTRTSRRNPLAILKITEAGKPTAARNARLESAWEDLLAGTSASVETAQAIAVYCCFVNGLGWIPGGFGHLAPVSMRKALPGYELTMESMLDGLGIADDRHFLELWLRHNTSNRILFPKLGSDAAEAIAKQTNKDGSVLLDGLEDRMGAAVRYDGYGYVWSWGFSLMNKNGRNDFWLVSTDDGITTARKVAPLGFNGKIKQYWVQEDGNPLRSYSNYIYLNGESTEDSNVIELKDLEDLGTDTDSGLEIENEAAPINMKDTNRYANDRRDADDNPLC